MKLNLSNWSVEGERLGPGMRGAAEGPRGGVKVGKQGGLRGRRGERREEETCFSG